MQKDGSFLTTDQAGSFFFRKAPKFKLLEFKHDNLGSCFTEKRKFFISKGLREISIPSLFKIEKGKLKKLKNDYPVTSTQKGLEFTCDFILGAS